MKASKLERIKKHLERGRTITPLQALRLYGSFRLADICFKLRRRGLNVVCEIVRTKTATFGKYSIAKS